MPRSRVLRFPLFNTLALRTTAAQTSTMVSLDNSYFVQLVSNNTLSKPIRAHFELDTAANGTFVIAGTTKAIGANPGYGVQNTGDSNYGTAFRSKGGRIRMVISSSVASTAGTIYAELQIFQQGQG